MLEVYDGFGTSDIAARNVLRGKEKTMSSAVTNIEWDDAKVQLVKNLYCKNATPNEFELFLSIAKRRGLDPMLNQLYFIKYGDKMTIITSIDGLRLIADRSGNYVPGKESTYTYDKEGRLFSATSYVRKRTADGAWHEISATAHLTEYRPDKGTTWGKMPHVMLAKCAEALALRKSFPAEMSGLYVKEEMEQAEVVDVATNNNPLNEAQCADLDTLLIEDLEASTKICGWLKIASVYEMQQKDLDRVMAWMKNRKADREKIS